MEHENSTYSLFNESLQAALDLLQRQRLGDEELLQGKFETAQRVEEEEELLQGKFEAVHLKQEPAPQSNRLMPITIGLKIIKTLFSPIVIDALYVFSTVT